MSAITLSPEQFIFASNNTPKTTSLKIAEAFEKRHDNVMRDIKKIIKTSSALGCLLRFEETVVERENPSGGQPIKSPAYEMDKDGFMLVVMGYTGEKAMAIKIAYINAFNWMAEQLQNQSPYGLKQLPSLPSPRAKTYIPGGLEPHQQDAINDFIKERLEYLPADKRKRAAVFTYSSICSKFGVKGMKHGYKNIPPEHFDNIIQLIARLPLEGELLLRNESNDSVTISLSSDSGLKYIMLKFETDDQSFDRWFLTKDGGTLRVNPMPPNELSMTFDEWIKYATLERGYIVAKPRQLREYLTQKLEEPVEIRANVKSLVDIRMNDIELFFQEPFVNRR
jgi:Rha family phage regulatory protein